MDLTAVDARSCEARRSLLAGRLGASAALIPSGSPRPRNYLANTFPFRACSHFLYLFGLPLRGAWGLWTGEEWTVFLPAPEADAALWHGPEATGAELGAVLGCPVRPLADLAPALSGKAVMTVAAPDRETCGEQSRLVGRPVEPGSLSAIDLPLCDAIISQRLQHDAAAVGELRAAAAATAAAHRAGMRATRPKIREHAVRGAMEAELVGRGMTVAYGSIVTVHGEVLHNEDHHHVLGAGELLLADVGAETPGGWAADVTRTWPVSGRYSPAQTDLYDLVLEAQQQTIAAVKPGVRYRDLHLLAARALADGLVSLEILRGDPAELVADGVVALLFPHGIGHLLGLDVHDMEDLGDRAGYAPGRKRATEFGLRSLRLDRDLLPGMAVTIEPGLYLVPAILEDRQLTARTGDRLRRDRLAAYSDVRGIRIEDDVLVTESGHEVLTAAIPKTRDAIESVMR